MNGTGLPATDNTPHTVQTRIRSSDGSIRLIMKNQLIWCKNKPPLHPLPVFGAATTCRPYREV